MKKILTGVLTALLLTGFIFTGCKTQTPEDNNGNNNTENTEDSKDDEKKDEDSEVSGAAVTEFKATAGNAKVTLSWTNPTTGTLSSIKIYNGTTDSPSTLVTTITDGKTSYDVTGLTNGTKYYFKAESAFTDDSKVYTSSVVSATPRDLSDLVNISSVDFAKELTIGWNLGNSFDAPTETGWGMPTTTKAMIDAVAAAGFKTIRIPVSWSKHVTGSNYTIDSTWMNRVKEVVDWAIDDGMYVILNVHHDNYFAGDSVIKDGNTELGLADSSISGFAITTDATLQTKSKTYLKKVWTQIATKFASYDNQLVFEVLNEPRCYGETNEWWFSDSASAKPYCDVITAYEKVCIETIRGISGNENRFIMVPGYAASGSSSTMLKAYTMPTDTATDKLLLSAHAYDPSDFAMTGTDYTYEDDDEGEALTSIFNYLKTNYTDKGIGVVMGEASCSNKDNLSERLKWFDAYFSKAKNAGIPVVLWDNMIASPDGTLTGTKRTGTNGEHHGYLNRTKCKWFFPTLITKAMDVVGVTGYSVPEYIEATIQSIGWNESSATQLSSTTWNLDWSSDHYIPKNTSAKEGSILKIVLGTSGTSFRMINSSWNYTYSLGTIVNGSSGGSDISASSTEVYYVLTAEDAAKFKTDKIVFAGASGTITAVYFQE